MFIIKNCYISIDDKVIVKNISLEIKAGALHAIMGPNGSGKSTLAQTIAGNPRYQMTQGIAQYAGMRIEQLPPHERAKRGIFLSFQQPPVIVGVKVFSFLKEIYYAVTQDQMDSALLHAIVVNYCQILKIDRLFLERSCNDGFSGGEKKRLELLQILLLRPKFIILDEIDSGLDVDALRLVAKVIKIVQKENPDTIVLIITHYQRILNYLIPDVVHILVNGAIMESGNTSLVQRIEKEGYDGYYQKNTS